MYAGSLYLGVPYFSYALATLWRAVFVFLRRTISPYHFAVPFRRTISPYHLAVPFSRAFALFAYLLPGTFAVPLRLTLSTFISYGF